MLIPLTREKFEQVVPLIATGAQYRYYSGKFSDFLQRLLISIASAAAVLLIKLVLDLHLGGLIFFIGVFGALYWMWGPVMRASLHNARCRRYKYIGFFRGRILDYWVTEEILGKQEKVNNKGELVVTRNTQKCMNLEIGDQSGFIAETKAPLRDEYKIVGRDRVAEMIVFSNSPDLSIIEEISDVYIPSFNLWIEDYPYVRRDFFIEVSRRLRKKRGEPPRRRPRRPRRRYADEDYGYDEEYGY